jgi:chemotaxis protein MotB
MKKKHEEHENHERWLISYADFITLLFAFFVVMFASSQSDKGRAEKVSESVKKALEGETVIAALFGGTIDDRGKGNAQMKGPGGHKTEAPKAKQKDTVELLPSLDLLSRELQEQIKKGQLKITMERRGLVISFQQAALFPSGGDEISQESFGSVEKVAAAMRKIPNPVRLEGHTDSVPIHNVRFRSNWELSAARSIALLNLLTDQFGIRKDKISIAGYADTAPNSSNDTDEGRARNRRVDIVILNETGLLGEPQPYEK